MKIKASCKFDYDSIKAFTHLALFKKHDPEKRIVFWGIIYAVLFIFIVLEMLMFGFDQNLFFLTVAIVVLYLVFSIFFYFLLPKIKYNSLGKTKNTVNEYIFEDDIVRITTMNNEYNVNVEIRYSAFIRVWETSEYFFLCQDKFQAFLVDKSTIVDGTAEDIREKLAFFVGKKYIICKY